MADISRTIAYFLSTVFQDGQAANSITEQDLRDLMVTIRQASGDITINVPAATNVPVAGLYYKAAGTTLIGAEALEVTDDGNTANRLKYTGAATRLFMVQASCSVISTTNNQVCGLKLAKNGTIISDTTARIKLVNSTDVNQVTLVAHVSLDQNDYVEVWITNETSTGSVLTVQNMHMAMTGSAK